MRSSSLALGDTSMLAMIGSEILLKEQCRPKWSPNRSSKTLIATNPNQQPHQISSHACPGGDELLSRHRSYGQQSRSIVPSSSTS